MPATSVKMSQLSAFNAAASATELKLAASFVDEEGLERLPEFRFLDWKNRDNEKATHAGLQALMVLGLAHDDPKNRQSAYNNSERFLNAFREANGSYLCNELLGCDVRIPEGVQYARDNHLFTDFCPKMVESAVDILEDILSDQE